MEIQQRHSGIELFRILSIMAVMMFHYCLTDCAAAVYYASRTNNTFNYYLLLWLEAGSMWAVNGFVLISGYFLCRSNRRTLLKPVMLFAQSSLLHECVYLLSSLINRRFSWRGALLNLIPSTYFVMLYIALYLLSPALNLVIERANRYGWRKLLTVTLLILCVWPTLAEFYFELRGTNPTHLSPLAFDADLDGMTLIQFVVMYLLGGFLHTREERLKKIPTWMLLTTLMLLWGGIFCWELICLKFPPNGLDSAFSYSNPLVTLFPVVLFLLFRRISIQSRLINSLAGGCYTCYLLHYSMLMKAGAEYAVQQPFPLLLLHILLTLIASFIVCWIISLIWTKLSKPVWKYLKKFKLFADFELL